MKRIATLQRFSLLAILLFALTAMFSCASRRTIAIEEGWELLTERKVNFVRDKDEIEIDSRNLFTAVKFRVEEKDIRINSLRIFFDNGDKLEPSIDEVVPAGKESRLIELARDGRRIDRIEFKYRTTGSLLEGRANVLVFGKRYNPYGY